MLRREGDGLGRCSLRINLRPSGNDDSGRVSSSVVIARRVDRHAGVDRERSGHHQLRLRGTCVKAGVSEVVRAITSSERHHATYLSGQSVVRSVVLQMEIRDVSRQIDLGRGLHGEERAPSHEDRNEKKEGTVYLHIVPIFFFKCVEDVATDALSVPVFEVESRRFATRFVRARLLRPETCVNGTTICSSS